MSIESKLRLLISTKTDIKAAINEKGVMVNDALAFAEYGNKIREIESGDTAEEEKNALLLKKLLRHYGDGMYWKSADKERCGYGCAYYPRRRYIGYG